MDKRLERWSLLEKMELLEEAMTGKMVIIGILILLMIISMFLPYGEDIRKILAGVSSTLLIQVFLCSKKRRELEQKFDASSNELEQEFETWS